MRSRILNPKNPCLNLSDYLRQIYEIRKTWRKKKARSKDDSRALWFRGERSAKWELQPRIYRPEYRGAEESEIRLAFEGNGLQLLTTNPNRTKWEWYFLMQHYSAPTRLLDWTENPLVALYFAISDERKDVENDDAAVWTFDPWRWNRLLGDGLRGPALAGWEETKPYLPDLEEACDDGTRVQKPCPIAIEPPSIDSRLASQTARFLLFGKKKNLVEEADRIDLGRGKKQSRLEQILISSKNLENIRIELDDLGINHRMLFPDLGGLGNHLSWAWKRFPKRKRLYP